LADSSQSRTWWRIGPGDEPFLTQTLQVHFVQLPPRSSNRGHGHQNEAASYILAGRGYEFYDDRRYDWSRDDLVLVHADSVHRHFKPYGEQATALAMKAKCAWMYLGLLQQGRSRPRAGDDRRLWLREDWSRIVDAPPPRRAEGRQAVRDRLADGKARVLSSSPRPMSARSASTSSSCRSGGEQVRAAVAHGR
jgi:quercetin dioxygenase-like cupin family protein